MTKTNANIAKNYYSAMNNKDLSGMKQYLHPDVEFIGPLANFVGKTRVLEAAEQLFLLFNDLTIRTVFSDENQTMIVFNLNFSEPIGQSRAATLMTIHDGLIKTIELFYDARPFENMKNTIFAKN